MWSVPRRQQHLSDADLRQLVQRARGGDRAVRRPRDPSPDLNLRSEKITNFIEEQMVKDMGLEDPVVRLTSMRNAGIISSSEMEEGIEELR